MVTVQSPQERDRPRKRNRKVCGCRIGRPCHETGMERVTAAVRKFGVTIRGLAPKRDHRADVLQELNRLLDQEQGPQSARELARLHHYVSTMGMTPQEAQEAIRRLVDARDRNSLKTPSQGKPGGVLGPYRGWVTPEPQAMPKPRPWWRRKLTRIGRWVSLLCAGPRWVECRFCHKQRRPWNVTRYEEQPYSMNAMVCEPFCQDYRPRLVWD